jgi:hypothetical protein
MLRRLSLSTAISAVTVLSLAPVGIAHAQYPSSTNGSFIYINSTPTNPEIDIVNSDGTGSQVLNAGAANIQYTGMDANSNASKLVYSIYDQVNPTLGGIYVENTDGTGSHRIAADNSQVYLATPTGIDLMNADGTSRSTLYTNTPTTQYLSVAVNSAGTAIALSTFNPTNNTGTIMTAAPAGGSTTSIVTSATGVDNGVTDWSPDGTKILYTDITSASLTDGHLYSINPDGTGQTTLITNASGSVGAGYSPDATKLIVIEGPNGGPYTLSTANADGSNLVASPITNNASYGLNWTGVVLGATTTVPAPVIAAAPASTPVPVTPGLPKAGTVPMNLPIAFGIAGLFIAAGIETTRRLRAKA